jgi:hypothetical protein
MIHHSSNQKEPLITMSDYIFKLKKGELELELKSDDAQFIEAQMDAWRSLLLSAATATPEAE